MTDDVSNLRTGRNESAKPVFEALRHVARNHPTRFTEISEAIGVPTSSAHRALRTLEQTQLIARTRDGQKLELGVLAFELLDSLMGVFPIRDHAMPLLRSLAADSGETASLAVRIGPLVARIAATEGWHPLRTLRLGKTAGLHVGASGPCLLAFEDAAFIDAYLALSLPATTTETLVDASALRTELDRIRKRGYSADIEGAVPGVVALAFPVLRADGSAAATICIDGPSEQFDRVADAEAIARWGTAVADFAGGLDEDALVNPYDDVPMDVVLEDVGADYGF